MSMENQVTQQAVLVNGGPIRKNQSATKLALYDADGNPVDISDILSRLDALEGSNPEAQGGVESTQSEDESYITDEGFDSRV